MNVRVDLQEPIRDGMDVVFKAPCNAEEVTGLNVYYPVDGVLVSQNFAFADANANDLGHLDALFAKDAVVKVILDLDTNMAFVQNADTNAYLEGRFDEVSVDDTCVSKKPWSSENIVDKFGMVASASGAFICLDDCFPIPVPVKGLKAYVMARQEGSGTPSAENVRPIIPYEGSTVTVGIDRTEDMPTPTLYSSGTLPENCYGGYVDWTRGVFVQTHGYVALDGKKGSFNKSGSGTFNTSAIPADLQSQTTTGALQSTGMCNSIVYGKEAGSRVVYCSLVNVWFKGFTECEDAAAFKAYLQAHPVEIVYPLETPIEHTLVGNEEIWLTEAPCYIASNGSNLEVTYVADTKAYIDKKFAELQHAIIALGSI